VLPLSVAVEAAVLVTTLLMREMPAVMSNTVALLIEAAKPAAEPPLGVAQVPSPRQYVDADADVPPLRLATGRLPVTPVDSGNQVALASVMVGPVANTAAPVPVSSVSADRKLAEDGVDSHVSMPAAVDKPLIVVPLDR